MTRDLYPLFDVADEDEISTDHEIIDRIWRFFVGLRGGPLLPSCREIETVMHWLGRDIPEHTIRDGVEQALAEYRLKSTRPGFPLTSCRREVHRLFLERTHNQALTRLSVSSVSEVLPEARTLITLLLGAIERSLGNIPVAAEGKEVHLRSFRRYLLQRQHDGRLSSLDTIDEALQHVDRRLSTILMEALPADVHSRLQRESELILSKYRQILNSEGFERIVTTSIRERARVHYGLRPLTILDLLPSPREG